MYFTSLVSSSSPLQSKDQSQGLQQQTLNFGMQGPFLKLTASL